MEISIQEFKVAMETIEARRLKNRMCEGRNNYYVPSFEFCGVEFYHSGSHAVYQGENKVPEEIMERAMDEFGENYPEGGNHFTDKAIYSVKGLLTVAIMLKGKGKYSRKKVNKLAGRIYKRLLDDYLLIQSNAEISFQELPSPKMKGLRKLLVKYCDVVNPFGNDNLALKKPVEYLDKVRISINPSKGHLKMYLTTESSTAKYYNSSDEGIGCQTTIWHNPHKGCKSGYTHIVYYCNNERNIQGIDEVICLEYCTDADNPQEYAEINLKISMKTGLAWKGSRKEEATQATDEQIATMQQFLKETIKDVKTSIINNMVYEK